MILNYCAGRFGQKDLNGDSYTVMGIPTFPMILTMFSDFSTHQTYVGRLCWHLG